MKLRIASDLHLEFIKPWSLVPSFDVALPPHENDLESVLILAGDIFCASRKKAPIELNLEDFQHVCRRFKYVVYINGNHEYYNSRIDKVDENQKEIAKTLGNLFFLNNDVLELEGQRIVGTTLWTDISPVSEWFIRNRISDYRAITFYSGLVYRKLNPSDTALMFQRNKQFLLNNVREGDIVVTHHAPSYQSMNPKYKGSPELNEAYYNTLDGFIYDAKPKLWIHGHTHSNQDYNIDCTRVICNPRGYQSEYEREPENRHFNEFFFVDV